jgi:hypothetical protein
VAKAYPKYDASNPAKFYADAFEARHPFAAERQREIELNCAGSQPKFGYATLAELISHERYGNYCNTVLTTNFDDLVADAIYLYGDQRSRPLVVTHEALARYLRTSSASLRVEIPMYLYAHDPVRRDLGLSMLKKSFAEGRHTDNWNFSITLDRAAKESHPNLPLLTDLTRVANDELNRESLDKYPSWREA